MKKRILIITDSPRIYTGFANIGRHVATYLHNTGKWDVHYLGWFDSPGNKDIENFPFPIYHTMLDDKGHFVREDSYAYRSFPAVHDHVQPDICMWVGDLWMACANIWNHTDKATRPSPHILYNPVDHDPLVRITKHGGGPTGNFDLVWADQYRKFDDVVAYCKYGQDEINKVCGEELCKGFIHHGTDNKVYHPLSEDERIRYKKEIFGLNPEDFLIITVARNQPRKLYPSMIQAVMRTIGKEGNRKIYYYSHCPMGDPVGWDLGMHINMLGGSCKMIGDHNNPSRFIFDDRLGVGAGPSDEVMNQYYNAADLGLFIYNGEGWALPPMDCMAAGTATIMTEYSAPIDWAKGATYFVKPQDILPEPNTGFMRATVSIDNIYKGIMDMYKNDTMRRNIAGAGLRCAQSNDWENVILPQWGEYLDSIPIKKRVVKREVIHLSDADTIQPIVDIKPVRPKVNIIICTHVGGDIFKGCIESIRAAAYENYELIIVDNGSWIKDSKDYIKELRSQGIKVLPWNRKYHPTKMLNMAAREADGEYLLFMDNDVQVSPGYIDALLECFNDPRCGAASPKLVQPYSNQFCTGLDYDQRLGFQPSTSGEGICEKHGVPEHCMMTTRKIFEELGGFDEGYLLHHYDADYCCRLRIKGYVSICNTKYQVMHLGGVSRRYFSRALHETDHMRLIRKFWPQYIPTSNSSIEKVAIIKLLTMGDAILITPMLPEIRKRHPNSKITLFTLKEYSDIFTGNPNLDEIKTVGPLDKNDFGSNWGLMAYDSITYNIMMSEEWDYMYECNQLDYWMEYRRAGTTMAQTYADMFDLHPASWKYQVYLDQSNIENADRAINSYPGDGPIVVMHTTAGWELKEWTKEGFIELSKLLWDKYKARIFVVGAPGESLNSLYVRNLGGMLSLRDIVALYDKADLAISLDSGPLHLAKATNVPILAIFGCTNPAVVGFDEVERYITIQSPYAGVVNCGFPNCKPMEDAKTQGKPYTHCTARLGVDDVWDVAQTLLDSSEPIHEHRKGRNKCKIEFIQEEYEWFTSLIEGTDVEGMCPYRGGGTI